MVDPTDKGSAPTTVVSSHGGEAITLAHKGQKTKYAGKTYTVATTSTSHKSHPTSAEHAEGHNHKQQEVHTTVISRSFIYYAFIMVVVSNSKRYDRPWLGTNYSGSHA